MFGLESSIHRIYSECKGTPQTFLTNFGLKISQLIRSKNKEARVRRVMADLQTIAEGCKQRGLNTGEYLDIVTAYANQACDPGFDKKQLDPETLKLR